MAYDVEILKPKISKNEQSFLSHHFSLTRTGLSLTWLLSASIKIFVIYKLFIYFYSLHLRRSCFVHELLSRIVLVWFLCILFFNFLAHFIKIFDDLSPLLYVFKTFISQKLLFWIKWGANSQRSWSLYCLKRNSDEITIGKTHSTLLKNPYYWRINFKTFLCLCFCWNFRFAICKNQIEEVMSRLFQIGISFVPIISHILSQSSPATELCCESVHELGCQMNFVVSSSIYIPF